MKSSAFNKVYCSSAYCQYGMEELSSATVPIADTIRDKAGNYWCNEAACRRRYHLMNWGKAHNWPAIECSSFAVAQGRDLWHMAIRLGTDAFMQALADAITAMEEV